MIRDEELYQGHILVVDDEPANIGLLEQILLGSGFTNISSATNPFEALEKFNDGEPDLVLLDLHMPGMDGFGVMGRMRESTADDDFVPILVLTADSAKETRKRALASGANDFVAKPFDYNEVVLRIRNLLTTRLLHVDLQRQNERLDDKVRERTLELGRNQLDTLERLARAAEYRDDDTGQHTRRVGELSARVAIGLGLPRQQAQMIRLAAPLHDIGKIAIPDFILLKPGKLMPDEWEIMKTHTTAGAKLLAGSSSPLLRVAEVIALSHHEKWDGTGYPHGLSGENIPLPARIVAVADVFDALSSDRPYRKAWPIEIILDELESQRGKHFDPRMVDVFLQDLKTRGVIREESLAVAG